MFVMDIGNGFWDVCDGFWYLDDSIKNYFCKLLLRLNGYGLKVEMECLYLCMKWNVLLEMDFIWNICTLYGINFIAKHS